jgi:hypothetical protein
VIILTRIPACWLTGYQLEKMDDAELAEAAVKYDIFARTSPEHKLRLVHADNFAFILQRFYQAQLMLRAGTGEDVILHRRFRQLLSA